MTQPISNILILVVEDECLIQDLIKTTLEDAGYATISADDGPEALAMLEREGARLGGLVTDVNLGTPVNGWKVAARGRELNPGMPVVYISGDSAHEWAAQGVPNSVMISKPFAQVELVVALASLRNQMDVTP